MNDERDGVAVRERMTEATAPKAGTEALSPRMAAAPAAPVEHGGTWAPYYSFSESGGTIAGLGDLYTWNKVSPRLGVNLKVGHDDKTVVRGTIGRYYRPLFWRKPPRPATPNISRRLPKAGRSMNP